MTHALFYGKLFNCSQIENKPKFMKTYHDIFEAHGAMVLARSQQAHADIVAALGKKGALPLTVGACQMRNCRGGASAKKKVQMLAFPEMYLPGYFTRVDRCGYPAPEVE